MWKGIVAGTVALAIAGTSAVYAQQRYGRSDGAERWRPSTEDMRAFGEARLAALKAGLALTAEQEKNWPAFEQAARDFGKLRLDRMSASRSAQPTDDPVERIRRRATAMTDTGAALQKLADATDPLYKSLDDNQKRRFAMLGRLTGRHMDGPGHYFRGERDDFRGERDGSRGERDGSRGERDGFRGERDEDGPRYSAPRRMDDGQDRFDRSQERRM